jgi:hypothetical protein
MDDEDDIIDLTEYSRRNMFVSGTKERDVNYRYPKQLRKKEK